MATAAVREFDDELDELFEYRTHWLRSLVRKKEPGAAPKFNKRKVETTIQTLRSLAFEALLSSRLLAPLTHFYDNKRQWHPKRGKGYGITAKQRSFRAWYDHNITHKNCVYVFWKNRRCLYIGRTLNGKGRPSSHFEKRWFGQVTRIDVYESKAKRSVPAFECRLTHQYEPTYSKIRPGHAKGFWRCEVCDVEKAIRAEVKYIFALR